MLTTSLTAMLPGWVPEPVVRYLAHTEAGQPIRDLARQAECHASTVLRQIRRMESRRDDPLVDEVLKALGGYVCEASGTPGTRAGRGRSTSADAVALPGAICATDAGDLPDAAQFAQDSLRILRRLCETGAVLAVAQDMEKAVVVRDAPGGVSARMAVLDRPVAQAMALNEWISCAEPSRISRYVITPAGRSALNRLMAEEESARAAQAQGFGEMQTPFAANKDAPMRKSRYVVAESPLSALSRRKDRDGHPFLPEDLVGAGERLREDFELAQLGQAVGQNWERMLTGGVRPGRVGGAAPQMGASAAQDRVLAALQTLVPGLSDVALRCCCFLEGLEMAEKRLGWSARSGKIVLRIALQQLKRHYAAQTEQAQMIG